MDRYYSYMHGLGAEIAMIILLAILIVAVIWIITETARRNRYYYEHRDYHERHGGFDRERHYADNALRVLSERYAKGEITKEEFEQKKKDILA